MMIKSFVIEQQERTEVRNFWGRRKNVVRLTIGQSPEFQSWLEQLSEQITEFRGRPELSEDPWNTLEKIEKYFREIQNLLQDSAKLEVVVPMKQLATVLEYVEDGFRKWWIDPKRFMGKKMGAAVEQFSSHFFSLKYNAEFLEINVHNARFILKQLG
ncbi:hypothetical protein MK805_07825 [Shimazuella sp. AN120528]|uniref:hypothetical protein n=1 Tax=Shimazuella soli TaxID=1892854 RepID=UPI001F10E508|nr:hypothetical protein [Shimazuella soli]MCH5584882.1 hypothetical protein [Shimazuella soli]